MLVNSKVKERTKRPTRPASVNGLHAVSFQSRPNRVPAALVAGGAGFLGSHLCDRLLADGFRVYCVDSLHTGSLANIDHIQDDPRFIFMEHDVRRPLPALPDVREIYNFASPASPPQYQLNPIGTMTTNVLGTLELIELASITGARFLQASTSEVYGEPEVHPQNESYRGCVNTIGPRACYDEGKRAAEALCYDFRRARSVDVRAARIFNTYGPRMLPEDGRIVSNLIGQALRGEPLTIYGTGRQTRSFCYVADLIDGITRLMRLENAPPGPVNLGNPAEISILELAELVAELTGSSAPRQLLPLPEDDPHRRRPDIRLAERLLGWRPEVDLRRGLRMTVAWFKLILKIQAAESGLRAGHAALPERTRSEPAASVEARAAREQPSN